MGDTVDIARDAFEREAWGEAYAGLAAAEDLAAEDLERLAVVAYLVGRDEESVEAWERAHLACVEHEEPEQAARCAFWLGLSLLLRGEAARGGGWLARGARLVEEIGEECAARGYLLVPVAFEAVEGGDPATALEVGGEVVDIARRFGDPDLLALGLLDRGQALLMLGDTAGGMANLDEVMVSVTTGELSPLVAGISYCAVIDACMRTLDLRRAAEWTDALQAWCSAHPDLVPYRGQCLVHRSQVLQAQGSWGEAATEADRARRHLSEPLHPALGLALYQRGELHRLRGEYAEAEAAYRAASDHGREPAPGLALLRLAEGDVEAAVGAVRRMVDEHRGALDHPVVLAAAVEVHLAADDVPRARAASDELAGLVREEARPMLRAIAAYATGTVHLAFDDARAALSDLRTACAAWRELDMPYDVARARVQIGLACRALGDEASAELELDAARAVFGRLGAGPDLARVEALRARAATEPADTLTAREREVLGLVAAGHTNREIAAELVISEHTVARHLQNIFTRIDVSSRAAATAWAYEHGVV